MASNYPSGLDSLSNPDGGDALSTGHAAQHGNANDAIEAIEGELGTDPAGASATVKDRFDVIEANSWVTSARIADGTITGSDIASGTVTSANIADGTIVNADVNTGAAIAATKVAGTAVTQADTGTVTSTMIANGTIVDADVNASAAIAATKVSGTAVTQADTGTVTSAMIADGTIVNSDVNASAAIAKTKVSGTAVTLADSGTVTSAMIANDTIVDADINASAAIAGSKLADGAVTPIKTSGGYLGKSTAYPVTNDDRVLDVTGTTTVTLPTSVSNTGRTFYIRNSGTAAVTIATTSSQTLDGASTLTLAGKGFVEVVSDGSNWRVLRGQYAADETVAGRRIFSWNHAYSTGGGWQQTYGDTGIRSISSWDAAGTVTGTALPTGWGPVSGQAGFYRLQRVNSRITATMQMLQATSTNPTPITVPAGFTSGANAPQFLVPMIPGSGAQVARTWQQSNGLGRGASTLFTANDYVYQTEFTWLTPDAWPASLPGSAVGVIPL